MALTADELPELAAAIEAVASRCDAALRKGFVKGGIRSLWRIRQYYQATAGLGDFPAVSCNAPWISAVIEPAGRIRPCFFHEPYEQSGTDGLAETINSPAAIAFRRSLSVGGNETCRRCVCSLSLPVWGKA